MTPHHFVQQHHATGDWHVCHLVAGGAAASDGAARSKTLALLECAALNVAYLRQAIRDEAERQAQLLHPTLRPIPAGFYSDADAA